MGFIKTFLVSASVYIILHYIYYLFKYNTFGYKIPKTKVNVLIRRVIEKEVISGRETILPYAVIDLEVSYRDTSIKYTAEQLLKIDLVSSKIIVTSLYSYKVVDDEFYVNEMPIEYMRDRLRKMMTMRDRLSKEKIEQQYVDKKIDEVFSILYDLTRAS